MSSATVSLFVSLLLATLGAGAFAVVLSHPGVLVSVTNRALSGIGIASTPDVSKAARSDIEQPLGHSQDSSAVTIPAGQYGHFQTEAEINGRSIDVMVDTGASLVALRYEDAADLGIFVTPSDFVDLVQTANGTAHVAPVTISRVSIGDITVRDVRAIVTERGKLERTLLGMSFLGRLSRVEMRGSTLMLEE